MKAILLIALLVLPAVLGSKVEFESFLAKYHKHYEGLEYVRRLEIFEHNLKIAAQHQLEDPTAEHGVTMFSDMTYEEFSATHLMAPVPTAVLVKNCLKNGVFAPKPKPIAVPDAFDWRQTAGVVTEVKNQASCGSCWAFSTAANIEGVYGAHGIALADSLSPQFIVDCSKACSSEIYYGSNITVCNGGCNGGWPWSAFYDVQTQGGINGWKDYVYTGRDGTCRGSNFGNTHATIANFTCISGPNAADETVMQQELMTRGPLSIAVDANYFNSYRNGIMDPAGCSTQALNHAIALVGWGVGTPAEQNKPYWIVKNSWDKSWGEQGFARMARGKGTCGINLGVSCACLDASCAY